MRFAAGVEYDGSGFAGWQSQRGVRTVQDCVQLALSKVADHPVRVICAGRTDTGVHACGQVIHFDSDAVRTDHAWLRGTITALPADVVLRWVRPVAPDFHARFSAFRRSYRYLIFNAPIRPTYLRARVGWDYRPLDPIAMRGAAEALVGRHDFSAFRAAGCQARSPVRTLNRLEVSAGEGWLRIDVEADAFLQHMVRNIVGVLSAIGAGERPLEWAAEVLNSADRTCGGVTASPHGLYLTGVGYPEHYELPATPCRDSFW